MRRARTALRRSSTADVLVGLRTAPRLHRLGDDPDRWAVATRRAAAVLRAGCLPRSVVLARILHDRGHEPVLVLGARRDATGGWVAHAWVELDGAAVGEDASAFTRLARCRASGGWAPEAERDGAVPRGTAPSTPSLHP